MTTKINHPDYYQGEEGFETIKAIFALGWGRGFCLGNALKYISRAGRKGQDTLVEDLQKARWYLEYFINHVERK